MARVAQPGMGSSMYSRLDGIGHVLRDRPLEVPPYQRSYTWTDEEVSLFIGDLQASQGALEASYFIGTIVVTPSGGNRLVVIDGQQRLATTVMLFAAISKAFHDAGDEHRASVIESQYVASRSLETNQLEARLHLNDEDEAFFSSLILDPAPREPERQSHRRLLRANQLLQAAVSDEIERSGTHWKDTLLRWVTFLDAQVQVILVVADNDADAFLLFETLNDRGVDLTVADLLKNHLFGLARANVAEVEQPWLAAVENLDTDEDKTFTTFVRHYWSSIRGATREKELYRSLKRYVRSEEQAVELATDLELASIQYAALSNPNHDYWQRLDPEPLDAVGILLSLGLEQNRPLLLAAMGLFEPNELGRLVEGLVCWSVRGLIVGGNIVGTLFSCSLVERPRTYSTRSRRLSRATTHSAVVSSRQGCIGRTPVCISCSLSSASSEESQEPRSWERPSERRCTLKQCYRAERARTTGRGGNRARCPH